MWPPMGRRYQATSSTTLSSLSSPACFPRRYGNPVFFLCPLLLILHARIFVPIARFPRALLHHQRKPPIPPVVNPGSDNGKDDNQSGLGTRTPSSLSHSLQDEGLDTEDQDQDDFLSSENRAGAVSKDGGDAREILKGSASSTTWGHERVVQVPNETARWVFTNQAEPEEATTSQASTC